MLLIFLKLKLYLVSQTFPRFCVLVLLFRILHLSFLSKSSTHFFLDNFETGSVSWFCYSVSSSFPGLNWKINSRAGSKQLQLVDASANSTIICNIDRLNNSEKDILQDYNTFMPDKIVVSKMWRQFEKVIKDDIWTSYVHLGGIFIFPQCVH